MMRMNNGFVSLELHPPRDVHMFQFHHVLHAADKNLRVILSPTSRLTVVTHIESIVLR